MPIMAARMALMVCVAGMNGLASWKNSGSTCSGYAPPPAVTCKMRNRTAIALPRFANASTNV